MLKKVLQIVGVFALVSCSGGREPTETTCDDCDAGHIDLDASVDAMGDGDLDASLEDVDSETPDVVYVDVVPTPDACADVSVSINRKTNVIFIVDQSTSMDATFGSGTRWSVLKNALLADTGIISTYQNVVDFGVTLYSSRGGSAGGTCPMLTEVAPMLNNLAGIRTVYQPARTVGDTPTGESIDAVLTKVPTAGNTLFVLATDGEPDTCAVPNPQRGQQRSIDAVTRAFNAGVKTYVLAVANESELSQSHVNALANAGAGVATGAPSYRVSNDQGLRAALDEIVYGGISCDVQMNGRVQGTNPCVGNVTLGGSQLNCSTDNGWSLVGDSTLRLAGDACSKFKTGSKLEASFPCESVIILY